LHTPTYTCNYLSNNHSHTSCMMYDNVPLWSASNIETHAGSQRIYELSGPVLVPSGATTQGLWVYKFCVCFNVYNLYNKPSKASRNFVYQPSSNSLWLHFFTCILTFDGTTDTFSVVCCVHGQESCIFGISYWQKRKYTFTKFGGNQLNYIIKQCRQLFVYVYTKYKHDTLDWVASIQKILRFIYWMFCGFLSWWHGWQQLLSCLGI